MFFIPSEYEKQPAMSTLKNHLSKVKQVFDFYYYFGKITPGSKNCHEFEIFLNGVFWAYFINMLKNQ